MIGVGNIKARWVTQLDVHCNITNGHPVKTRQQQPVYLSQLTPKKRARSVVDMDNVSP